MVLPAVPFPGWEAELLARRKEELLSGDGEIISAIEDAYRVLERCPQGRSAMLYLTTDLGSDAACAALLKERECPVWLRCCRELLSEE